MSVRSLSLGKLRAYLAGPDVFLRDPLMMAERKKQICAEFGLEGVSPVESDALTEAGDAVSLAMAISRGNEDLMRNCDLIVANMTPFRGPSLDAGTAYEMGFMRALGKAVFGYTNSNATYLERVRLFHGTLSRDGKDLRDPEGMQVEDFGLLENLMLEGAVRLSGGGSISKADAPPDSDYEDLKAFRACVSDAAKAMQG